MFVCFAGATVAQQTAPVQDGVPRSPNGKCSCPNESLMNGMACHVVGAKQDVAAKSAGSGVAPQSVSVLPSSQRSPRIFSAPAPVDTRILAGSTVFIVPMEGLRNYLAAALQKKSVPLVPVANDTASPVRPERHIRREKAWLGKNGNDEANPF